MRSSLSQQCARESWACLLKDASTSDVIAGPVRTVSRGEAVCPSRLCGALFRFIALAPENPAASAARSGSYPAPAATGRARGEGLDQQEIASRLNLSEFTVRNHIHRILKQVDAETRSQAVEAIRSRAMRLRVNQPTRINFSTGNVYFLGTVGASAEHLACLHARLPQASLGRQMPSREPETISRLRSEFQYSGQSPSKGLTKTFPRTKTMLLGDASHPGFPLGSRPHRAPGARDLTKSVAE
jgi:hypothetical protein